MKKRKKPVLKDNWSTHVYLDTEMRKRLEAIAGKEERTLTGQARIFILQGIKAAEAN